MSARFRTLATALCVVIAGLVLVTPAPAGATTLAMSGAMEGNLKVTAGDKVRVGYALTMPDKHPAATVTVKAASFSLPVKCPDGTTGKLSVTLATATYAIPLNSNSWYPTGDQKSAASYQGAMAASPYLCNGLTGTAPAGISFTADFTSTDTIHKVNVRVHYSNNSSGGWSGAKSVIPSAATTAPPVISKVAATEVSSVGAKVTWATDRNSDSQVDLGTTTSYGRTVKVADSVTAHSVAVTGLQPHTLYHYRVRSAAADGTSATSTDATFTTGAVPLLLETDMFSSTDDVGALATAHSLQHLGEARIIGVGVNTRSSRPKVATSSWKCVAAIDQFYGAATIPIGTALPNDGTETSSIDWVGACAKLASSTTPVPGDAVAMYRKALAAEADGSVVIASFGYLGNLARLLASPADAYSSLTGRDLVAKKVARLVVMGGGYPSRAYENNVGGDVASSQAVASGWPTKVVWSGYEVGDLVHNGNTLSSTHPANSPVRVAYEAFVGPGNWMYSYDLTSVYEAVRPNDPVLTESATGTNVVDNAGGNAFTTGTGTQTYLLLHDATALSSTLESLIAWHP